MQFDINLTNLLLFVLGISTLIYFFVSFKRSFFCRLTKSEKDILFELLDEVILVYKSSKLTVQLNELKSKYDINKDSEVNAIKTFNNEFNIVLTNSCKDIISNYLSISLKDTLGKYVTEDYIIMYIITKLSLN